MNSLEAHKLDWTDRLKTVEKETPDFYILHDTNHLHPQPHLRISSYLWISWPSHSREVSGE